MQLIEGDAKRRRDARGGVQRGIFLVVLHPAQHLTGNAGFLGEPAQRPSAPFAPAPDDARQRAVFRHGQRPSFMPASFHSCLLVFHTSPARASRRRNRADKLGHGALNRDTRQNPKSFKKSENIFGGDPPRYKMPVRWWGASLRARRRGEPGRAPWQTTARRGLRALPALCRQRQNRQRRMVAIHARIIFNF